MQEFMNEKSGNKVNNNADVVKNPASNQDKKTLDEFYNKEKEVVGEINKNISDFKQWLFEEHNINLDDDSNLREDDGRINEAKKIIDEATKSVINVEAEMGNGYTDKEVAIEVNKSLIDSLVELRDKIQKFKDQTSKEK